jgi:type II secretory pathway component PulF
VSHTTGVASPTAFRHRSAGTDGAIVTGELHASSPANAASVLRSKGLWPLEITAVQRGAAHAHYLSIPDLSIGLRVLATILQAGVPVGRVMHVAAPSLPPGWQPLIGPVTQSLESGATFTDALRLAQVRVPRALTGLLSSGEAAGNLAGALRNAAELAERSAAMRSAVIGALAYPLLLFVAGGAVVGLLTTVVIPRFAGVLANLGQELPASTQLVLNLAASARVSALPLLLATVTLIGVWAAWRRTPSGEYEWHRALLSLPVFGALRHALASARACDALGALLESGMTVATALPHAGMASGDAAVERRLLATRKLIVEGSTVAHALRETGALTPSTTRLIGAGEAGGALIDLLRHAARIEADAATSRTKAWMRVVEPTLIVLLGILIASVAIALLQAVYSVRVNHL